MKTIESGVPQGSILGPVLFLFYINDIVMTDPTCKFVIYADDCAVFASGKDIETITCIAGKFCHQLKEWCRKNSLTLNEAKTKCVLYRAQNTIIAHHDTVILGPYKITIDKSVKTLGVIFSEHMSWNDHVRNLSIKLSKTVGILNRNRHLLPGRIKKLLYNALFYSQLCYCALVWANTSATNLNKINLLQKKAIRIIENVPYLQHTAPLFQKHAIIKAENLYTYRLLCSYKNAVQGRLYMFLEHAHLNKPNNVYSFRYRPPWQIPFSRTTYGTARIRHALPVALNYMDGAHIDVLSIPRNAIFNLFL